MRREDERHQKLRGRTVEPHGDHDHHGQEGGHGPIGRDDGGEQCRGEAEQHQQPHPALAGLVHDELAGPRGDAGHLEARAHHEQRGDEDDHRVAEAAQSLPQVEHAREVERERRAQSHQRDRDAVPGEQDHDGADDGKGDRAVTHGKGSITVSARAAIATPQTACAARRRRGACGLRPHLSQLSWALLLTYTPFIPLLTPPPSPARAALRFSALSLAIAAPAAPPGRLPRRFTRAARSSPSTMPSRRQAPSR